MSRRYTPEEKQTVLQRLQANGGDVALTSAQTGVSPRTLYHWQKRHLAKLQKVQPQLPQFAQQNTEIVPAPPNQDMSVGAHGNAPASPLSIAMRPSEVPVGGRGLGGGDENLPFDWQTLHALLDELTGNALDLASSLGEVIDDAPLNQRAAALAQIIDRIMKLAALLPPPKTEQVFRIEYVDPDGSIHNAPFWARKDSEE